MNCRRPASIAACDILAVTISVERGAGLVMGILLASGYSAEVRLDHRANRVKPAKFLQIPTKVFFGECGALSKE
jgi:hypothetical protein